MRRDVWGPAVIIPVIVVPVALLIFLGIAVSLELLHDFSLAIGTVLFVGISLGAWLLARRTEPKGAESNPPESTEQH